MTRSSAWPGIPVSKVHPVLLLQVMVPFVARCGLLLWQLVFLRPRSLIILLLLSVRQCCCRGRGSTGVRASSVLELDLLEARGFQNYSVRWRW